LEYHYYCIYRMVIWCSTEFHLDSHIDYTTHPKCKS
jgi:hypothetical protein